LLVARMKGSAGRFGPAAELIDGPDAAASGHLDVHHTDLGGLVVEQFTQFGAGGGHTYVTGVGETVQRLAEPFCKELMVVCDHHTDHLLPHSTVTVVPAPASESNLMAAPIFDALSRIPIRP